MVKDATLPTDSERQQMDQWKVPFWRSAEGYPAYWTLLSADEKRWEYLRRSTDYRVQWEALSPEHLCHLRGATADRESIPCSECVRTANRLMSDYNVAQPIHPALSFSSLPGNFTFHRDAADFINSPSTPYRDPNPEPFDSTLAQLADQQSDMPDIDPYQLKIKVEFDLRYSLDEQCERVRTTLDREREKRIALGQLSAPSSEKFSPDDYAPEWIIRSPKKANAQLKDTGSDLPDITYLRILDGYNAGATFTEIGTALSASGELPDLRTIKNRYSRASEMWKRL